MAVGDPHIKTFNGKIYELPHSNGNYRMLQGKDLIINASISGYSLNEKKSIAMLQDKIKKPLITSGSYFRTLC